MVGMGREWSFACLGQSEIWSLKLLLNHLKCLLVVSPHSKNLDGMLFFDHLVDDPVLNAYPSDKLSIG